MFNPQLRGIVATWDLPPEKNPLPEPPTLHLYEHREWSEHHEPIGWKNWGFGGNIKHPSGTLDDPVGFVDGSNG